MNVLEGGAVHVTLYLFRTEKIVSISGKRRLGGDWFPDHKIL